MQISCPILPDLISGKCKPFKNYLKIFNLKKFLFSYNNHSILIGSHKVND